MRAKVGITHEYSFDLNNQHQLSGEFKTLNCGGENLCKDHIGSNNLFLEFNHSPWLPTMGEFHYSRYPCQYWQDELLKIKAGGITVIATYVFWIFHEEDEGQFDWNGQRNLRFFIELCAELGFHVVLRIGPFCHGEVRNGGIPDWLYGRPFPLRCNDAQYMSYVERLYSQIAKQVEGLLFKDNGPVIGIQLENEFMHSGAPWETTRADNEDSVEAGSDGEAHMVRLKETALEAGLDVPLYLCTGWGSPVPTDELIPMQGGYAFYSWVPAGTQAPSPNFVFYDYRNRDLPEYDVQAVPYLCCEIGGGIQVFYENRPVVPPESIDAMTIVKLGCGTNMPGYYMYHGGSNPLGRHSFLNEGRCPRISYDFQAPIGEFGQIRESYRRIKRLLFFLNAFGHDLAPMTTRLPDSGGALNAEDTTRLRIAVRHNNASGYIFLNNYQDHVELPDRENVAITLVAPDGETKIGTTSGINLKAGHSSILPFNLEMEGVRLIYATAQLVTRLRLNNGSYHYFFFAVDGIHPEFLFAEGSGQVVALENATCHERKSGDIRLSMEPGRNSQVTLKSNTARTIKITTLTDEESLNFWMGELAGTQRVLISDSSLVFAENSIILRKINQPETTLSVYPHVTDFRSPQADVDVVSTDPGKRAFQDILIRTEAHPIEPAVKRITSGKYLVTIPVTELKGSVSDIFLALTYTGDTACAYLNGQLISDNFNNGTPWVLGLKRFLPDILDSGVVIMIYPGQHRKKGTCSISDMAAIQEEHDKSGVSLDQVCTDIEYQLELTCQGGRQES